MSRPPTCSKNGCSPSSWTRRSHCESRRPRTVARHPSCIQAVHHHIAQERRTDADEALLHDALLFQFVVIGEAVKHLDPATRDAAPEIPWADIAGLRDLIAHEYFRIEIDRILEIVEGDLPSLERAVDRLLAT